MATEEDYDLLSKASFIAGVLATTLEEFDKSTLGKFAKLGRNANVLLFVGGVGIDLIRLRTDPNFTQAKFWTNTTMGAIGFAKYGLPIMSVVFADTLCECLRLRTTM